MTPEPLVRVLVNRGCAHCVGALDRIAGLAARCGVPVAAVDVAAHPKAAADRGVRTSPALIVGDGVAYLGVPDAPTFSALVDAADRGGWRGPRRKHPHPPDVRLTHDRTEDHP